MAREIERRTFTRDAAPKLDASGKMHGKAAPFNSPTMIGNPKRGGFREKINPGAFTKSVTDGDIVLLDNHNTAHPIARMSAGTLRVEKRADGAYWDADPVDTSYSRDAQANIDAGNYGGCSFGFEVIKDAWTRGQDGVDERELLEVRVHEISTVTFPAYTDTAVSMRSAVDVARETAPDEFRASAAPKPYGQVKYADPDNGKYPIDTKAHVKAAWSYINVAKNAAKYASGKLAKVKAAIKAAAAKFGININEENSAAEWAEIRDFCTGPEWDVSDMPDAEEGREFPDLTAIAAELITAYNMLPEDKRAEQPQDIRDAVAALTEKPEPDTSTQDEEARENTALEDAAILASASLRAAELTE